MDKKVILVYSNIISLICVVSSLILNLLYINVANVVTFYFILIIFLGFLSVSVVAVSLEKTNGIRVINLTTGSMRPELPIASIVVTKPFGKYGIGDVVTYYEKSPSTGVKFSRTFTHRIIEERDEKIILKFLS